MHFLIKQSHKLPCSIVNTLPAPLLFTNERCYLWCTPLYTGTGEVGEGADLHGVDSGLCDDARRGASQQPLVDLERLAVIPYQQPLHLERNTYT